MHKKDALLIEIGTEELPAKSAKLLSEMLGNLLAQHLTKEDFGWGEIKNFSTPRRIAVLIEDVDIRQPDKAIERKGPALTAALDKEQKPTAAGLGFARSCGVSFEDLEIQRSENSAWLIYRHKQPGKALVEIAPFIVQDSIHKLHPGKTMRWSTFDIEFLRPVHWIVLMFGNQLISTEILDFSTTQQTFGHRFHRPQALLIPEAKAYESILETQGQVIPDFQKRRAKIKTQIQELCIESKTRAIFNESLLDEVTGLVEWPVAFLATYTEDFLTLPKEVLTCSIEHHQKCFPVENQTGELKPYFIGVSNIGSSDPSQIVIGNERVMRARLADAAFFYYTDKKQSLENRLAALKSIAFQVKLGSLWDKTQRLSALAIWIGEQWRLQSEALVQVQRAGLLSKTDLATEMVREFPELQGIMGYYYALHDKEPEGVAIALQEQYLPRFSGDRLPTTQIGCALAIADRIDNLVGIFSLGQIPSGDKDPFGLKRAAMGISRILIENALSVSLDDLIEKAVDNYASLIEKRDFVPALKLFIIERLRAWYSEKGISTDIFNAVIAIQDNEPLDIHHRIMAVEQFKQLPQAQALTLANKRVSNILSQATVSTSHSPTEPNPQLFKTDAEKNLYLQIKQLQTTNQKQNYVSRLTEFASLQRCVDQFFDDVMVMDSDQGQRNNRLQLLVQLRSLFLQVADISVLQA
jgi:glycyl-tRNA synthetase beta chain